MYVIIFLKPLSTQGCCFIYPKNSELSGEINVEICIIEKSKKNITKKLYVDVLWNRRNNFSRHNTMPEKCRTLFKYENDRYIS